MSVSDELAKYYKKGGGSYRGGWGEINRGVKATVSRNMPGVIQNFAKIGDDMYIHADDVGKALKGAHGSGLASGKLSGAWAGAQFAKTKAADSAASVAKNVAKGAFGAGARAMLGPAAIAGMALQAGYNAGKKRAQTNPEFHRGKIGKSYLDLSTNKPGKYGVDY
tara:strand:- start:8 stop:502 length:495 start_codon:yes stop_codon:yes gene_type:complete